MGALAMAMFVVLFAFGEQYFGWGHADGKIQLALVASFIFGIIFGYRVKD